MQPLKYDMMCVWARGRVEKSCGTRLGDRGVRHRYGLSSVVSRE